LALAFIIDKPFVTSALTGQTSLAQLRDNLGALGVSLSDEIKAQIQAIHQRIPNPAP
jgi:aryl-alcohol dehydrogenase-like predicted oxidoreductase